VELERGFDPALIELRQRTALNLTLQNDHLAGINGAGDTVGSLGEAESCCADRGYADCS
jgi:hypothetical protein